MTRATTESPQSVPASPLAEQPLHEVVPSQQIVEFAEEPPDEDSLYEVVKGRRVEKPPMGLYECGVAAILFEYLAQFARLHQLGRVRFETLFRLGGDGMQRRPDVAFVAYARWPKDRKMPRTNAWDVVPNLVVEVVSRTNRAEAVLVKVDEYLRVGVQLVWVVYPVLGQVYVFDSPTQVRILQRQDELDGGAVLPNFRLAVATLFEDELEQAPLHADD